MSKSKERSLSPGPSSCSSPRPASITSTQSSTVDSLATAPEFQPTSADAAELERELAELDSPRPLGDDVSSNDEAPTKDNFKSSYPAFLLNSRRIIKEKYEDLEWTQRDLSREHNKAVSTNKPYSECSDVVTSRNRYVNVDPYYHNRVHLKVPPEHCDYINASPIVLNRFDNDDEPSRYIATQGPKEETMGHFWHMVWHETPGPIAIIIMLTRVVELGKIKCFDYVPHPPKMTTATTAESPSASTPTEAAESASTPSSSAAPSPSKTPDPIPIFLDAISLESPAYSLSSVTAHFDDALGSRVTSWKLRNEITGQTKQVQHYAFEEWPDFFVPEGQHRNKLMALVRATQQLALTPEQIQSPRIVHCSAGVGRSGTYIAIDYLLRMLNEGRITRKTVPKDKDLVHDTIETLRKQRMMIVQGEAQYTLIYDVLREEMGRLLAEGVLDKNSTGKNTPDKDK